MRLGRSDRGQGLKPSVEGGVEGAVGISPGSHVGRRGYVDGGAEEVVDFGDVAEDLAVVGEGAEVFGFVNHVCALSVCDVEYLGLDWNVPREQIV